MRIRNFFSKISTNTVALCALTPFTALSQSTDHLLSSSQIQCYTDILHQIGPINTGLSRAESRLRQAQRAIDEALQEGCITEARRTEIDGWIQSAADDLVWLQGLVETADAALDACFEKGGITPSFYNKGQQWIERCQTRIQAALDLGYHLGFEVLPEIPAC